MPWYSEAARPLAGSLGHSREQDGLPDRIDRTDESSRIRQFWRLCMALAIAASSVPTLGYAGKDQSGTFIAGTAYPIRGPERGLAAERRVGSGGLVALVLVAAR